MSTILLFDDTLAVSAETLKLVHMHYIPSSYYVFHRNIILKSPDMRYMQLGSCTVLSLCSAHEFQLNINEHHAQKENNARVLKVSPIADSTVERKRDSLIYMFI